MQTAGGSRPRGSRDTTRARPIGTLAVHPTATVDKERSAGVAILRYGRPHEDSPLEALFTLALTTGMRQGELLGLRWRDIDWSARRVAVRHTLVRMDGRWWLGDPKTASSQRAIDLTAPTIDLLRAHRARTAERMLALGHTLSDDDLVFCDDAGQPLWGRHVTTRQLKPLLRDAGLPPIRFHDLRHYPDNPIIPTGPRSVARLNGAAPQRPLAEAG